MTNNLKIKCLMIDHDDTTVVSAKAIYYRIANEVIKEYFPETPEMSWEYWFYRQWYGGLRQYWNEVGLTEEHIQKILKRWDNEAPTIPVCFFDGFYEFLQAYRKAGGIIVVSSNSQKYTIETHYNKLTNGEFMPDLIIGVDRAHPERNKPGTYGVELAMKTFGVQPHEMAMVDDMKGGLLMARKFEGMKAIGVLYSDGHDMIIKEIEQLSTDVAHSVNDLYRIVGLIEE